MRLCCSVKTNLYEIGFSACNALYSFESQIIGPCIPLVKSVCMVFFFPMTATIIMPLISLSFHQHHCWHAFRNTANSTYLTCNVPHEQTKNHVPIFIRLTPRWKFDTRYCTITFCYVREITNEKNYNEPRGEKKINNYIIIFTMYMHGHNFSLTKKIMFSRRCTSYSFVMSFKSRRYTIVMYSICNTHLYEML
jgi:hypothetical protein